jgi:hypothetical protein
VGDKDSLIESLVLQIQPGGTVAVLICQLLKTNREKPDLPEQGFFPRKQEIDWM